ncbi:11822_t:CDS:2 [Cetraspora pellucida]|uniref:11822_t:CDS:1 n=1 Tax=Cetraspora pellucida TaxID=1433469 RepID=A0ACA9L2F0_9GLOM|nr:11822_t:CDS:2 [Cetraspora pellucida]
MSLRKRDKFAIFVLLSILTFAVVCIMTMNDDLIANEKPRTVKYIVKLKQDISAEDMENLRLNLVGLGANIYKVYNSVIMKGFAVEMPQEFVGALSEDKNVELVEPDQTG